MYTNDIHSVHLFEFFLHVNRIGNRRIYCRLMSLLCITRNDYVLENREAYSASRVRVVQFCTMHNRTILQLYELRHQNGNVLSRCHCSLELSAIDRTNPCVHLYPQSISYLRDSCSRHSWGENAFYLRQNDGGVSLMFDGIIMLRSFRVIIAHFCAHVFQKHHDDCSILGRCRFQPINDIFR
eukprot:m.1200353 g.1200353  ORF g.1200353 m.1200353 type:complete len:182 (+) comp24573_c0_seq1:3385-3930(+)